jgi:hypothetical protein
VRFLCVVVVEDALNIRHLAGRSWPTRWHNDDGIGVCGVKFATYFDHLTGANGALRVLPGSHHPEQSARLLHSSVADTIGVCLGP